MADCLAVLGPLPASNAVNKTFEELIDLNSSANSHVKNYFTRIWSTVIDRQFYYNIKFCLLKYEDLSQAEFIDVSWLLYKTEAHK